MIPWIKEQISDAWHNRKSTRTAKKGSLALSTNDSKISEKKSDNKIMSLSNASTSSGNFSVNVVSLEGEMIDVAVKPDCTVEKLKIMATKHFYGSEGHTPSSFHLIHAEKVKQLSDESNLRDQEINAFDELLMVQVRPAQIKDNFPEDSVKGPNIDAIIKATSHLQEPRAPKPKPTTDCPANFEAEIRKILITLVQASAKILMHSPESAKLYEIIREKLELRYKPLYDPKAVKYLTDIGFSEKKVLIALRICKMNVSEALEWLIEREDDSEHDNEDSMFLNLDLDSIEQFPGPSSSSGGPSASQPRRRSIKEACIDIIKGTGGQDVTKENNLMHIISLLLQSFHQYKRLEFRPNSKIKESLIEMGFEEKKVIEALKVTGNNQLNACEWLLGTRNENLHDFDSGLNVDSPIYEAIMNNSHIRLSLTNPKMLLAYLSILETPSSTSIWINDPEVSPVLSQIFKTYHSEKHAIHMSRYESIADS
ncbi:ubiquitin-associated domain-containing protein 1 [Chelonus insularis]|uniref:ubiquitin-associated domain-containing protein 1 n=1 Tax=Chelonus insularis TaxID=460826 RepID=UPI001589AF1D|nr:ubiquitin-associated domain-containing protein 1 [Chelonus insularis]XP_034951760.1 ubiquitin-associated domain-containing protein 1 [Chelonus insularis]